jgi:hypothetical protein
MKVINLKTVSLVLLLLLPISLLAQVNVSGVVVDGRGETLPGVNIIIKGTTKGTVTNYDGEFTIQASPNDVIEASYIGFDSQEITVGNQTEIKITLRESSIQIQELEVVAVG